MSVFWITLVVLVLLVPVSVIGLFIRHHFNTAGMAYYGRPLVERRQLKQKLAVAGRYLSVVMRPLRPFIKGPEQFSFFYKGIGGPIGSCSKDTFAAAEAYAPQPEDVFVVTQMKCGTTWMQHIVYETLCHGRGDLTDSGHNHLYAASPWLESFHGVPMEDAPLIGPAEKRLIKTHMPTQLCPYAPEAKYIYVTRHPVSCYRSTRDFFSSLIGPLAPQEQAICDWFCSDRMGWGSWPNHVDGFWRWAQQRPNVIFIHFEEMKADLPAVVDRVADFLGETLSDDERTAVIHKCGFEYMKAHEEYLDMHPPTFFSVDETMFRSGAHHRHEKLDDERRAQIVNFCRRELAGSPYPAARFYPDLVDSTSQSSPAA